MELEVVKIIKFNSKVHLRKKTGSFKDNLCKHVFNVFFISRHVCPVYVKFKEHLLEKPWIEKE